MDARRIAIPLLLIFVLFALTACGSPSEQEEDVPTLVPIASLPEESEDEDEDTPPAEEDTPAENEETPEEDDVEPEPEEPAIDEGGEEIDAPILSLSSENNYGIPDNITSYRTSVFFETIEIQDDGTEQVGTVTVEGERDVAADESTFTATASGTADFGDGQSLTFTQIGDVSYIILPGGQCATFSGETPNDDLYGLFFDDGGFLGDLNASDLGIPPIAEINGVNTYHYVFDETNLNPANADTADITSVEGDIYVAIDGGYVVRAILKGIGQNNLLSDSPTESEVNYELNYFDFNQPVSIVVPEGCADVAESDYPVLDDAYEVNALPGVYTYLSNVDVATAVEFYQTEMINDGWTLSSEFGTEQGGLYTFTNDEGAMVQVAIAQEGEGVSIGIIDTP